MAWQKIGTIRKGKAKPDGTPGNLYISIASDVTLTKGDNVRIEDPRESIKASIAAGRLTEERGQEMLAKVPDYIRYELVLPPKK